MNIHIKNKLSKVRFSIIFITILALYFIYWRLNINIAMAILGLPILFYFPGYLLINLIPSLNFDFYKFGKFSLEVFYSFAIICILGLIFQSHLGFNSNYQIWGIIIANISLYIVYFIFNNIKIYRERVYLQNNKINNRYSINWQTFIPIILFACAISLTIYINPLVQNADDYFVAIKQSILSNNNIEPIRPLFISFFGLVNKFLRIDILIIYRNIFLILFFISSLLFYDYLLRNIKTNLYSYLIYLSLLAPSVIITELNIIRPQVGMLTLTITILILTIESIKNKNILSSIIALGFSFLALLFHQLGVVLIFIVLIALGSNLWRLILIDKIISWKHIILFFIIIIPYCIIINISSIIKPTSLIIIYALHTFSGFHWRWWFINSYTTIDGVNLGWPGINGLFYYLYNGILLFLLMFPLVYLVIKKHLKIKLYFITPIIYFIIFFLVAELLPRMGIFFIPNRAWVHLMIAAIMLIALLIEILEKKKILYKYLAPVSLVVIIFGFCGSVYVAKNNINRVYKEEYSVAKYINDNTPQDSIIISSQDNNDLVSIYGNRKFSQIYIKNIIDKNTFDNLINLDLYDLSYDKIIFLQPKIVETIDYYKDEHNILQNTKVIQSQSNEVIKAIYNSNNSIYFLYSYRKLKGLNNKREYMQNSIDSVNDNTYKNLGYPIVYSDNSTILIKVK
jgi:hypothetical protein